MSGVYGNENLAFAIGSQFLTIDGSSDTITVKAGVRVVDLYATTDCWVIVGEPGATPTAAAPGAEKTEADSFFLPTGIEKTIAIPQSNDSNQIIIAAIQASAGGTLYVTYREV